MQKEEKKNVIKVTKRDYLGGKYTGDWDEDDVCPHGKGIVLLDDGEKYEGNWKDGELEQGIYTDNDGKQYDAHNYCGGIYTGDWDEDNVCPHGDGMLLFYNKDVYNGSWEKGAMHGYGEYFFADGDRYEGGWKDSKKDGHGAYFYSNGINKYTGDFKNGKEEGYGVFFNRDQIIYEGEWMEGKRHGKGKYNYTDGGMYNGDWKEGKRHGHGACRYKDGETYEGGWENSEMHGYGLYTYTDGAEYEGEWGNGERNGKGTFFDNGKTYKFKGTFKDDIATSLASVEFIDNNGTHTITKNDTKYFYKGPNYKDEVEIDTEGLKRLEDTLLQVGSARALRMTHNLELPKDLQGYIDKKLSSSDNSINAIGIPDHVFLLYAYTDPVTQKQKICCFDNGGLHNVHAVNYMNVIQNSKDTTYQEVLLDKALTFKLKNKEHSQVTVNVPEMCCRHAMVAIEQKLKELLSKGHEGEDLIKAFNVYTDNNKKFIRTMSYEDLQKVEEKKVERFEEKKTEEKKIESNLVNLHQDVLQK